MRENDTTGVFYARSGVVDEPRVRVRVLLLVALASVSLMANALLGFYLVRGGVR
jgi:hypothetical protein